MGLLRNLARMRLRRQLNQAKKNQAQNLLANMTPEELEDAKKCLQQRVQIAEGLSETLGLATAIDDQPTLQQRVDQMESGDG